MAGYRLSSKAAADLETIYEYTILNFGVAQARTYLSGLHQRFQSLAGNPTQGRSAADLAPALLRSEYQSHILFYVAENDGVRIVRVLHQSMDVRRHL